MSANMNLPQKYLTVLNELNWRVVDYVDSCVEIQTWLPSGNPFQLCVRIEKFIEDIETYANRFDVDEYIETELENRQVDESGHYDSAYGIIQDAEILFRTLNDLVVALKGDLDVGAIMGLNFVPSSTENIQSTLVLHYSHVTQETMRHLRSNTVYCVSAQPMYDPKSGYLNGIFVIIRDDWKKYCKNDDLRECIEFAQYNHCDLILFTGNAQIVEELATYNEDDDYDLPF